jgi:hypothetical protein
VVVWLPLDKQYLTYGQQDIDATYDNEVCLLYGFVEYKGQECEAVSAQLRGGGEREREEGGEENNIYNMM